MKVGILTIHFVPNYGAMLQACATASYLRSEGHQAEVIDYRQPALAEYFRQRWSFPPAILHWLRCRRCDSFVKKHIPLGKTVLHSPADIELVKQDYDAFITGSDQVWFTGPVQYYDPLYFLDFDAPGKRKISYAASVGGTEDFGEFKPRVAHAVQGLDHFAVRDSHSASVVAPLSNRAPILTVDPTFLYSFENLIPAQRPIEEPYLLVFGDFRGSLEPSLREIAAATGLKRIVTLQYPCPVATDRVPSPGPIEWLQYFHHADFVATSYFHGTVFAAKFKRPFLSIPTKGRRQKVATLLEGMGLAERCFLQTPKPGEVAARARQSIDWGSAHRLLETQIENSKTYLRKALS
jgi:hypothetical protein